MRTAIIIDGNYLLYKNVFILKNIKRIKQDLDELMFNDFKKLTKRFHFDDIYFVSDSKEGNWRKILYKEYKGKRVKDETIDWNFVFDSYEKFKQKIYKLRNVKTFELPGLESDDFISYIVKKQNNSGTSFVILSSDGDLQQLINYDINKKYINIQWNYKFNDERIYLPSNYQLMMDYLSKNMNENIFELDNSADFIKFIEDLINKTKVKSIVQEEIVFCKMIEGDKGDNIPTCIKMKDGEINEEGRGIGKDGAKTLYNLYKEVYPNEIDLNSDIFIDQLVKIISYSKKIKNSIIEDQLKTNLIFNRKMVLLDIRYMPVIVKNNLENHYLSVINNKIEYDIENLEQKLDEDDFFNDFDDNIPEEFSLENSGETFNPDSFWDL
ncbi:hypothetical protein M0Q97_02930 [Candidatus Dojkabacteria bacterium]|jgi:hypothetical protein|nr:hypothetical protein [Candidatus Dojkabacteria bacterium]